MRRWTELSYPAASFSQVFLLIGFFTVRWWLSDWFRESPNWSLLFTLGYVVSWIVLARRSSDRWVVTRRERS